MQEPRIVYGGGAIEVALSKAVAEKAEEVSGEKQWPFKAIGQALEVIPRILVANCGESTIRAITSLKAKHAEATENHSWGIDGMTGQVKDMKEVSFAIFSQLCIVEIASFNTKFLGLLCLIS